MTVAAQSRRRFSIREVERMLEAGIVDEDEPFGGDDRVSVPGTGERIAVAELLA